jgi:2-dehydropantoate 2-reductase
MRVAVVGAGAIGAYVGAALARGGADVVLVALGDHLRAMQRRGVEVLSARGDFRAHPAATDDLDVVSDADVVIVSLKAYSLPEVAPRLGAGLKPGAATVWAQNGVPWWFFQSFGGPLEGTTLDSVDPGGAIRASIPAESVVGTVVYASTELVAPGVVRHIEGTRFQLGEPDGQLSDRVAAIAEAFTAGGLKAPIDDRLRDQVWLKLIGNVAFNTVAALTGATLGELGTRPETVALLRSMLEEAAAVGEAMGLRLPVSIDRRLERGFAVGDHRPSTLQDLEAGKSLELECMTGAVIELAELLGVQVPQTRAVHACATMLDAVVQRRATLARA